MIDFKSFLCSTELLSNILGGIVAALVLGLIAWVWRLFRECRVKQLGDLMGRIIEHRNVGKHQVSDPTAWVQKAKDLEIEAVQKASKVSTASGILINWIGELPNDISIAINVFDPDQIHYVHILTTVISRIRDTLARHDK